MAKSRSKINVKIYSKIQSKLGPGPSSENVTINGVEITIGGEKVQIQGA